MNDDFFELPSQDIDLTDNKGKQNRKKAIDEILKIFDNEKIQYDLVPDAKRKFINNQIGILGDYKLFISVDPNTDMKKLCSYLNKELIKYGCHVSRDNYNTLTLSYGKSLLVKEQEMRNYDTIVFDIGGVLIEREEIDLRDLRKLGIYDEVELRQLMIIYYDIANENDTATYKEVLEKYEKALPDRFKPKAKELIDLSMHKRVCKYTVPLLKELKSKGYKLYYLSNASKHRHEVSKKKGLLNFLEYFDGGLISYKERVEKPNPEFYNRLLKKYKLKASDCLFIDDNSSNIETAQNLGFKTLYYNNPKSIDLYSIIESAELELPEDEVANAALLETKRSELPDSSFGIPEDRKYPLDTEQHVRSAIKLFGHAEESKKKSLAQRINAAAKEYDISIPETTQCYKYLSEGGFYTMIPEDINTIVFDMGGVLVDSDIEGTILTGLNVSRMLAYQIRDLIISNIFCSNPKNEKIKTCSLKYIKKYFYNIAPDNVKPHVNTIFKLFSNALFKFAYTDELIDALKSKGYSIYYLSNWYGWSYELEKDFFRPLMAKFDGGLFSFETNYEKPQEEFYEIFFNKFNLDPKTCLFFDDKAENILAAEKLGMRGIVFDSKETPKHLLNDNFNIPSDINNKILISTGVNLEAVNTRSIKSWFCSSSPNENYINISFVRTIDEAINNSISKKDFKDGFVKRYVYTKGINENGKELLIPLGIINVNEDHTYEWDIQYPLESEDSNLSSGLSEWSMASCNPIKGISKPYILKITPDNNSTINPKLYAFSPDIISDKYLVVNENAELEIVDADRFNDCLIESYEFIGDNQDYLLSKIYKAYKEHKIVDNTFFYTTLTGKPMLCEDQIDYDSLFYKVDIDLMIENINTEMATVKRDIMDTIYSLNTSLPVLEGAANSVSFIKHYNHISIKEDIDGYYFINNLNNRRSRSEKNIHLLTEAMLKSTL